MSFVSTLEILNALKTAITALQLPATYAGAPGYPAAFQKVEIYREVNPVQALEDMRVYSDRACFIIPGGDAHENVRDGRVIQSHRDTQVEFLIADRNYGRKNKALVGDEVRPGLIVLKDLLIEKLTGQSLGLRGIFLTPESNDPFHYRSAQKGQEEMPGRDCWILTFTTTAGSMKAAIAR